MDTFGLSARLQSSGQRMRFHFATAAAQIAVITDEPLRTRGEIAAAFTVGLLTGAAGVARAQTPFLEVAAVPVSSTGAGPTQTVYNQPGPITASLTTGSQSAFATASFGLLGGSAASTDPYVARSSNINEAKGTAVFADTFLVQDIGGPVGALIPITISTSIFGSHSESSVGGGEAYSGFSIYDGLDYLYSNTLVDNEYLTATFLNQNGVEATPSYAYNSSINGHTNSSTYLGGPTISVMVPNDSEMFFESQVSIVADSLNGGTANSDYANTFVTNMSSTDSNVQFIGSQGTNYRTLTDMNNSASAPEPGVLMLCGLGGSCLIRLRRKL